MCVFVRCVEKTNRNRSESSSTLIAAPYCAIHSEHETDTQSHTFLNKKKRLAVIYEWYNCSICGVWKEYISEYFWCCMVGNQFNASCTTGCLTCTCCIYGKPMIFSVVIVVGRNAWLRHGPGRPPIVMLSISRAAEWEQIGFKFNGGHATHDTLHNLQFNRVQLF